MQADAEILRTNAVLTERGGPDRGPGGVPGGVRPSPPGTGGRGRRAGDEAYADGRTAG
ncbi:MAG: hypothetical protein WDN45_19195 [Caulobacteraceae bacterium]